MARDTGVHVGRVTSGEAFKTLAGQRIALSEDGQTYLVFDLKMDKIKIVKHGVVVKSW